MFYRFYMKRAESDVLNLQIMGKVQATFGCEFGTCADNASIQRPSLQSPATVETSRFLTKFCIL